MSEESKSTSRRTFLKSTATAGAALAVANRAPAVLASTGASDRIRVAMIGVGTQGHGLLQAVQAVPNTEIRVICDLYTGNIKRAQGLCTNKNVRIVKEWEKVVEDKEIDAVIIAVPDFWHAPITVAAAQNKKDVYVEKGWCITLDEAKRMRAAVKDNKVVMQLGHHMNSIPTMHKAREIFRSGALGKVPLVRVVHRPHQRVPRVAVLHGLRDPGTPGRRDARRTSTGSASSRTRRIPTGRSIPSGSSRGAATGTTAPASPATCSATSGTRSTWSRGWGSRRRAVTQGGKYFWKEDREVPDMWHVLFDYPKQELAVTFGCSFHNRHVGELIQFLGRDMTLECSSEFCRTYVAEWKQGGYQPIMAARQLAAETRKAAKELGDPAAADRGGARLRLPEGELQVTSHMQNFIDCVRSRELPRCHVDRAFEEAVALIMSLESYRRDAKVRWDPVKEEIV